MSTPARWHTLTDADALARQACAWITEAAHDAIGQRGHFSLVLAGGRTPEATYQRLGRAHADWARWHVYFGDERCLPVASPGRNSKMASDFWLARAALLPEHVHPIPAELGAAAGAEAYARVLQAVDEFDCVLLGLGDDGHTASLFPGHDLGAADDAPDVLAVHDAPKPPPERVSQSAARLSRARRVLFLVAGESKRAAVAAWRAGADLPAAAIRPAAGVDVLVEAALLA